MGSEQSTPSARTQSILKSGSKKEQVRCSSPGPSISSDSDIPYISYTVNRPIGDSPKLSGRSPAPSPRASPRAPRPKSYAGCSSGHDIVVVKEGLHNADTLETDPDLIRLARIPTFQPIMRGALHAPALPHDPEVLGKLDHRRVLQLCRRLQQHLCLCADVAAAEQAALAQRIREIDFAVTTLTNMLSERQKKFAKHAEQFGKVQEVFSNLHRCQVSMQEIIKSMEVLNNLLPPEERLEPFVMVTG